MKRMHWSWDELQATPLYVRRYCLDILSMQGEHERKQISRAQAEAKRARG